MIPRSCHRTEVAGNFPYSRLDIVMGTSHPEVVNIPRRHCSGIVTGRFHLGAVEKSLLFHSGAVDNFPCRRLDIAGISRPVVDSSPRKKETLAAAEMFRPEASALPFAAEIALRPIRKAAGYFGSEQKFLACLA